MNATRSLVAALGAAPVHPAVFLSASALGYYGDRGDEVLTETSAPGRGFLADVCRAWETEAQAAARHGVRTVLLRFGTVLAREGGALAKMLPVFRLGLGGRFGAGRQWMSWIALADVTGAVLHCLRDAQCVGPINFAAPAPAINADFTAALGRVLRRPAFLPVPVSALRLAFAGMADEALLASTRAKPGRLLETGYVFQQPQLEGALRAALR